MKDFRALVSPGRLVYFPILLIAVVSFVGVLTSKGQEARVFTNKEGRQMKGVLVGVTAEGVSITAENGKTYTLSLSTFSEADQAYIRETGQKPAAVIDPEKVNEAFGWALFSGDSLWSSSAAEVAVRLKMEKVSRKAQPEVHAISWYPPASHQGVEVLGVQPVKAKIRSRGDRCEEVFVLFANRYDHLNVVWQGTRETLTEEQAERTTSEASSLMVTQLGLIEKNLTSLFGAPRKASKDGGNLMRWTGGDSQFTVTFVPDRCLFLKITPGSPAPSVKPDSGALAGKVADESNGDRILTGLPFSGGGLNAADNFESASRRVGVDVDADVLKNIGISAFEDPVSLSGRMKSLAEHLEGRGATIQAIQGKLTVKKVKDVIDLGVPIILGVRSTETFRGSYMDRIDKRRSSGWADYKTILRDRVEFDALHEEAVEDEDTENFTEITMLAVGYNEDSGEIALDYRWKSTGIPIVWITADELAHFTPDKAYAVVP